MNHDVVLGYQTKKMSMANVGLSEIPGILYALYGLFYNNSYYWSKAIFSSEFF